MMTMMMKRIITSKTKIWLFWFKGVYRFFFLRSIFSPLEDDDEEDDWDDEDDDDDGTSYEKMNEEVVKIL
jgi:hypothetical protein